MRTPHLEMGMMGFERCHDKTSEVRGCGAAGPHRGEGGDAGDHGEEVGARQVPEVAAADADAVEERN